jgi:hypothetical protein
MIKKTNPAVHPSCMIFLNLAVLLVADVVLLILSGTLNQILFNIKQNIYRLSKHYEPATILTRFNISKNEMCKNLSAFTLTSIKEFFFYTKEIRFPVYQINTVHNFTLSGYYLEAHDSVTILNILCFDISINIIYQR